MKFLDEPHSDRSSELIASSLQRKSKRGELKRTHTIKPAPVILEFNLIDMTHKVAGRVDVSLFFVKSEAGIITLRISYIQTRELKNVELDGQGENDPFAVLSFGSFKFNTEVIEEGGSDVAWNFEANDRSVYFEVAEHEFDSEQHTLHLYVMDWNSNHRNSLIGVAKLPIPGAL